ncbi:CHAT domain-containing protein [Mangrovivirga sp. M17]|uniref:CHAT domain-containing protein n=1 Tax=Mangrovivirga halotolerans TaxID=2993936 RepID=A0ABT3RN42_9BACT|nr:CHAT domain-containing tetratricopeptide repeat protein [Mangrovivirga halotolerans]MCX2743231.1 CHAT domain-containing protein [Mangrovivirga halotolerans]
MKKVFFFILYLSFFSNVVLSQTTDEKVRTNFYKGYNYIYTDYDSATHYFLTALEIAQEAGDIETQMQILEYLIFTSGYHYQLERYFIYLNINRGLLNSANPDSLTTDLKIYRQNQLLNEGNYYYKIKEYEKSKLSFQKLYDDISNQKSDSLNRQSGETLLSTCNFLASIYKNTGKYELSDQYYKKAIMLIQNNPEIVKNEEVSIAATKLLIAQLYVEMGKFDQANNLFDEVISIYKNIYRDKKMFKNNLITAYDKTADNYLKQKKFQKALDYLQQSEKILIDKDPFYKKILMIYGDIYAELNQDKKALDFYKEALSKYIQYHDGKNHQDISLIHLKIAKYHLKRYETANGLESINEALKTITINSNNNNSLPNPGNVYSKRLYLELLEVRTRLLFSNYINNNDQKSLRQARETAEIIFETFDLLKKEFDNKVDKQYLVNHALPIFHAIIELGYSGYNNEKDNSYLDLAFTASEKSKDLILLDAIRQTRAIRYSQVPEKVINKESIYRQEILTLEKNLFEERSEKKISLINSQLNEVKLKYYDYLDSLRNHYPRYYDLKFNTSVINIEKVQKELLDEDSEMIYFVLTEDHIFRFTINKKAVDFDKTVLNKDFTQKVKELYSYLTSPSSEGLTSYETKLIEEISQLLLPEKINKDRLIIVRDGILNYIPFEVLKKNDYGILLNNHSVSYSNSATSLYTLKKTNLNKKDNKILAFAPSFKYEMDGFVPLIYNEEEIEKISQFFPTTLYTGNDADLPNFYSNVNNYQIIHFATHASANDIYPDYSYLAFSKNDSSENTLFIKDLYNMNLEVEMATLSACQTGIGKLEKGEGMISLSKGFYYAGVRSLVNSLWKINDRSTSKIMEYFYEELEDGKTKDLALRNAKLRYLDSTSDPALKHPYYWAAFVSSGNQKEITDKVPWYAYIFAATIFLIFLSYIAKKRFNQS